MQHIYENVILAIEIQIYSYIIYNCVCCLCYHIHAGLYNTSTLMNIYFNNILECFCCHIYICNILKMSCVTWGGKDGSPSPTLGNNINKSCNGSSVLSTSFKFKNFERLLESGGRNHNLRPGCMPHLAETFHNPTRCLVMTHLHITEFSQEF